MRVAPILWLDQGFNDASANVSHRSGAARILRNVVFSIRSMYALLFMFFLLSSAGASAGGYTVTYAFDVGDLNDAGKQECNYEEFCLIKSEKLQLSILLSFWDAGHKVVDVNVRGDKGRTGCCFFYDGVDSVKRKIRFVGSPPCFRRSTTKKKRIHPKRTSRCFVSSIFRHEVTRSSRKSSNKQ